MRLDSKNAIITGGGRGIGEATALKFAVEGARVLVADMDLTSATEVAERIQKLGGQAAAIQVDVTSRESVDAMVAKAADLFGPIDCLVNNAGITMDSQLLKMSETQFDKVLEVNLKGVFNCTQAVVAHMTAHEKGGVILNASSVVGLYGNFGQVNYAATKWGVIGMSKSLCKELGRKGIRVNAVAPGFIVTPMTEQMPEKVLEGMKGKTPLGVLGKPEDIANAYAFLASDEASFISGAVLSVDGGLVL